jgi:hypothetical protein
MPDYKNQHFVPCVYLKHFSVDGAKATRKSLIWRVNDHQSDPVPVESECADDWHYTVEDAAERERMFGVFENKYKHILDRIWSNKGFKKKQKLPLLLMMIGLHCRNPAYVNLTGKANIHAYDVLVHCIRKLIGGNAAISDSQLRNHLKTTWEVELLHASCEPRLITSDNPALWFTFDDTPGTAQLHLMILPVTPSCCAVAWDTRFARVTCGDLQGIDKIRLNHDQLQHCTNFIYGPSEPSPEELTFCRNEWNEREQPSGEVSSQYCEFNFLQLEHGTSFNFLSPV